MSRTFPTARVDEQQVSTDGLTFPGCHPKRIPRSEIASYEGRIEYWDRDTETAMVCEPTTTYHERPAQALAQLAALIGAVRGSPIETFGTCDLLLRDGDGERWRILRADQTVFLHPATTRPQGAAIEVLGGHLPDVVLEVDHSTDSRGGKLSLYFDWGFPEAWIEVPETGTARRPTARQPGLTIYLRRPTRLAGVQRQPCICRMAGARNPCRHERGRLLPAHACSRSSRWQGTWRPGRNRAERRSSSRCRRDAPYATPLSDACSPIAVWHSLKKRLPRSETGPWTKQSGRRCPAATKRISSSDSLRISLTLRRRRRRAGNRHLSACKTRGRALEGGHLALPRAARRLGWAAAL